MKKIIMQTLSAGPDGVFQPGAERTVDDKVAKDLVDGRYAIYASANATADKKEEKPKAETASMEQPEKAVIGEPEKKKGGKRK